MRLVLRTLWIVCALIAMAPVQAMASTLDTLVIGRVGDAEAAMPTGLGLPIKVRTALFFNEIRSFNEQTGIFQATTDLRLTWKDPGMRYAAQPGSHGYREFRESVADAEIAKIWTPKIRYLNLLSEINSAERRLRVYPDGTVEVITRLTGDFRVPIDIRKFPFDHQDLTVEIGVYEDTHELVDLDFIAPDIVFSRAAETVDIDGWEVGHVNMERGVTRGWNGDRYAKIYAALNVRRLAGGTIAVIFVPLFASLLIPFLAVWMNRPRGGHFEVEAFELGNVIVGGLFAVIALGVTLSSIYPAIVSGDNTVSRLLSLNYIALGCGILIIVFLYRFRLPARWFGPYVQEQLFEVLVWAFPVLFLAAGGCALALAAI